MPKVEKTMTSIKRIWTLFVAVCLLLAAAIPRPAAAQTEGGSFDTKAVSRQVADQLKSRGLVGLSAAVIRDGEVVLAEGFGARSLAGDEPVTPDTMFAIGSITKQFTSACLLLLAEEGKLSVMDKVAKYYPGLTRAGDITLLDLMNHVSGYPDYYPLDFVDRPMMKPIAVDEVIRLFGTKKLDF